MFILKKKYNNLVLFTASIAFSLFFSFIHYYIPKSIDSGLVISGIIKYPDHPSLMKEYFLSSFSLLNFFSAFILKLTNSIYFSSKIIIFLNTFFFTTGFVFLIYNISKSKFFSFLITLLILLFDIKSGSGDYPTLYFSEHIYGSISFSLFVFFLGMFANSNLKICGIILSLFLIIHPVTSCWLLLHFFFLYLLFQLLNFKIECKSFWNGFWLGLVISIFFLIYYKYFNSKNNNYDWGLVDKDFLYNFIKYFDGHRGIKEFYLKINIFILFINIFLLWIIIKLKMEKKIFFLISLIICLNLSGQILFIISRFYFDFYPLFIKNIMPTRFLTFNSPILIPLSISLVFKILNENLIVNSNFLKNKFFLTIILAILLITPYANFERVHIIYKNITEKKLIYNLQKVNLEDNFWIEIKKINISGHFITLGNESKNKNYIYYISLKPSLLDTTALNFLPYFPHVSSYYKDVLDNVYGINIKHLKNQLNNSSNIPEEITINHFMSLDVNKWKKIKKKYNVSGLVLNKNLKLKIKPYIYGKDYNFYLLN